MDIARVSADLFGRSCRLPIAIWVLARDKPRFFQSEPPSGLAAPTALRQELSRLVRAGLLLEERPDGENRVYYVRTESPVWDIVRAAISVRDAAE